MYLHNVLAVTCEIVENPLCYPLSINFFKHGHIFYVLFATILHSSSYIVESVGDLVTHGVNADVLRFALEQMVVPTLCPQCMHVGS